MEDVMAKTEMPTEIGPDTVIGTTIGPNEARDVRAGEIFDTPESMDAFRDAMKRARNFVPPESQPQ